MEESPGAGDGDADAPQLAFDIDEVLHVAGDAEHDAAQALEVLQGWVDRLPAAAEPERLVRTDEERRAAAMAARAAMEERRTRSAEELNVRLAEIRAKRERRASSASAEREAAQRLAILLRRFVERLSGADPSPRVQEWDLEWVPPPRAPREGP